MKLTLFSRKVGGGKTNGELLKLMIEDGIEVFVTADKNLQHQQNFKKFPIPVLVVNVIRLNYHRIKPIVPSIKKLLATTLPSGPTEVS